MHWTDSAEVYHPREPRSSPLLFILQKHFSEFLLKYDDSYVREFGYFRSIVPEVVQGYLKCGDLAEGFARVRCLECHRSPKTPSPQWRECIKKVWEVDPLSCPKCGSEMKIISFINEGDVIRKILEHLGLWEDKTAPPVLNSEKNYEPYDDGWPQYEEPSVTIL